MDIEDRLQGGQFESLPADKGGPGPAKCEPAKPRLAGRSGGREGDSQQRYSLLCCRLPVPQPARVSPLATAALVPHPSMLPA
jgi:hypothetical protein